MDDCVSVEESLEITNGENGAYVYPHVYEIESNPDVVAEMCKAWDIMMDIQTHHYRIEVGFYIYYDFNNCKYYFSELFYGPKAYYSDGGQAKMKYGDKGDTRGLCAFFHCHTPYLGLYDARPTGPSEADEEMADKLGIPGLLFDFGGPGVYINGNFNFFEMNPELMNFGLKRRTRVFI